MDINFRFSSLTFESEQADKGLAVLTGQATSAWVRREFTLRMFQLPSGDWKLKRLDWRRPPSAEFLSRDLAQGIIDLAASLLRSTNMWYGEQHEGSGQIVANEIRPPDEFASRVFMSVRSRVLSIDPPSWSDLWKLIKSRITSDDAFWVQGCSSTETLASTRFLERIFPNDWVKAQFRRYGTGDGECAMNWQFPSTSDTWFPAFHLARTAVGAICVDPAWVYLVEMGLARQRLDSVDGIDVLDRQLTRSSGSRHHLCMGALFHERGLLLGLEPNTKSGHNDLLVNVGGRLYEIEVKEFSSQNPVARLQNEIEHKVTTIPRNPERPVVIHVVLTEGHGSDPQLENKFLENMIELGDGLPPRISALIGGRCFLDSSGGTVKRDMQQCILNPGAVAPSVEEDLKTLFAPNYEDIVYPTFGFGRFIDTQERDSQHS